MQSSIVPPGSATTRWSLVLAAARPGSARFREALEELAGRYRPALVAFFRAEGHRSEECEDLVQSFLARWSERGMPGADPERGRFRAYLRGALRHFAANRRREALARKRGGRASHTEIPEEGLIDRREPTPEQAFDAAWKRELVARALDALAARLESDGRVEALDCFRAYYLDADPHTRSPTHADLARRFGVPASTINNRLASARAALRAEIVALVRHSVIDERALRRELDELCGEWREAAR